MPCEPVAAAVEALRSMIGADGFKLRAYAIGDDSLDLVVSSKPGACADSFVPDRDDRRRDAEFAAARRHVRSLTYPTD